MFSHHRIQAGFLAKIYLQGISFHTSKQKLYNIKENVTITAIQN
jgi:hypothetical protein